MVAKLFPDVEELEPESVRPLSSLTVKTYLLASGWECAPSKRPTVGIFRRPESEVDEVLLPLSSDFADLHEAMVRAVEQIARFEQRPARKVLRDLLRLDADCLRFAVEDREPSPDMVIGKVDALFGEPGPDGRLAGAVVLAAQVGDEILRIRLDLSPDDYQKAGAAHLKGLFVSVRGILRRGARIHRLEGATDFTVVSA